MSYNVESPEDVVYVIGAGDMARFYIDVLKALGQSIIVVTRSKAGKDRLEGRYSVPVICGGIEKAIKDGHRPRKAIVAVNIECLAEAASLLVMADCKSILLEKPGGATVSEILSLNTKCKASSAEIFIAYNRRFFSSVLSAEAHILRDGGLTSCSFDFTELGFKIADLQKPDHVKASWFLSNSAHVVDLAFNFMGLPAQLTSYSAGSLDWHPSAAQFAGAGVSDQGVVFDYRADWGAPGRWAVELFTENYRLILSPMEQLQVQKKGSFAIQPVEIDDSFDQKFKPGLYKQVKAWLEGGHDKLCSLEDQVLQLEHFRKIANY